MGLSTDFSSETLEARRKWADRFIVLKEKKKKKRSQTNNQTLQLRELEKKKNK